MTSDQFSLEPRDFPLCLASPQCPAPQQAACRTLFDHLAVRAEGDVAATAELLAVSDSKAVVQRARPELLARIQALTAAHSQAKAALHRVEAYLRGGGSKAARRVVTEIDAEYAQDGAHRRSRRLLPGRWTAEVVIVAAALFDTVFLGNLFRFLINADPSTAAGRFALVVAYVPGLGLAAGLVLTGLWLGRSVERYRDRRDCRSGDTVPPPDWVLPLALAVLTLTTVGVAAWVRPRFLQIGAGDAQVVPTWVVILLLVALSITAIAAKIVATNSHADTVDEADRRRRRADAAEEKLLAAAERAVLLQEQRWQELRESVFVVISNVEDLWTAVARHCGPVVLDAEPGQRKSPTAEDLAPLVRHTPVPPPAFGPILNAYLALSQHEPTATRDDLKRLQIRVGDQVAPPGDHHA